MLMHGSDCYRIIILSSVCNFVMSDILIYVLIHLSVNLKPNEDLRVT